MSKFADGYKPVSSYFKQPKTLDKVTNAEVLLLDFCWNTTCHLKPMQDTFFAMFPDSEIAKKYACAATKTAAIINYAIAPEHCNIIQ